MMYVICRVLAKPATIELFHRRDATRQDSAPKITKNVSKQNKDDSSSVVDQIMGNFGNEHKSSKSPNSSSTSEIHSSFKSSKKKKSTKDSNTLCD